jgi:hypothetical protein
MLGLLKTIWNRLRGRATVEARADGGPALGVGGNIEGSNVAMGDMYINPPASTGPKLEWWRRDHAPRIQLNQGRKHQEQSTHYDMTVGMEPIPTDPRFRWRGMGLNSAWCAPNWTEGGSHLPSVDVAHSAHQDDPELRPGQIAVEVSFWLGGDECHWMQAFSYSHGPVAPGEAEYDVRRW